MPGHPSYFPQPPTDRINEGRGSEQSATIAAFNSSQPRVARDRFSARR